jgi:transcription antitermination factor NusG
MFPNSSPGYQWFALRVKSNRERITSQALSGKGYEVFLPTYHNSRSRRSVRSPLFPGYLFTRFDVNDRLPVLVLPGVVHIVGLGKSPVPIDPGEVESLRIVVEAGLPINPVESFTIGQKVRIEQGPLASACGVIAGVRSQRLIVTITLLQRSVSVELQPDWISPLQWKNQRAQSATVSATSSSSATLFQPAKF